MTHDDAAKINNYYFSGKNTSMGKKFHMAKKAKQNYIYGFSRYLGGIRLRGGDAKRSWIVICFQQASKAALTEIIASAWSASKSASQTDELQSDRGKL